MNSYLFPEHEAHDYFLCLSPFLRERNTYMGFCSCHRENDSSGYAICNAFLNPPLRTATEAPDCACCVVC